MENTIIIITDFSKPYNNGWYYKCGFEKNGYRVIPISKPNINELRNLIKEIKPYMILHTKDEFPASIFADLKKQTKVIMWYPDPVIPDWLIPYVETCDIFFTMSEGLLSEFRKINPNSFWLTQAFEPSFFEVKKITDKDKKFYSSDVTFVGNLGSKEQYLLRRRALQRVIDCGFNFKWWGPRMPRKISTVSLIFGRLGRSYGGKFVWGEDYAKVAKLSKIFLAFDSMPHIKKSMSARMYTAVGCGAFYLCQHVIGIEEVLMPDKEIVTFCSEDEMIEKIKFYLKREDLRKKIQKAGQERVLQDHTYEVRIKQLMKVVKDVFSK
jgi:spore maturation protein CgeB